MSTDRTAGRRSTAIIPVAMLLGAGYPVLDYLLIPHHDESALVVGLTGMNPAAGLLLGLMLGGAAYVGGRLASRAAAARRTIYADLWPAAGASAAVIICWAIPLIVLTGVLGVAVTLTWVDHLALIVSVSFTFVFFYLPRMRRATKGTTNGEHR